MSQSSGTAPLVWFTSLAIGGAGIIAAALRAQTGPLLPAAALAMGSAALGAGMLVSLLHLGRKSRAPLAARGAGSSALSHEVVLAGLTLAGSLALLPMYWRGGPHPWMRIAVATVAMLFLVSIGRVYRLGGQRTWQGAAILLPLTTGLVCGDVCLLAIDDLSAREIGAAFWPVLIPADAMAFALRWWTLVHSTSRLGRGRSDVARLHRLSAVRLFVLDVMPFVLLKMNAAGLAAIAVVAGLAFDRWLFYRLADQHTTEVEIARVEAVIERRSRIS